MTGSALLIVSKEMVIHSDIFSSINKSDKTEVYKFLSEQTAVLLAEERNYLANAANFAALVFHTLPEINWSGFYFLQNDELILGPFQGKPACVRINLGRGVCGTAAQKRTTLVIENVHEFPGHIACDAASNSEIVVPLIKNNNLIGVFDVDSPLTKRFDRSDRIGLEKSLEIFLQSSIFTG